MPSQTKSSEIPGQEDSPVTTGKETELDRLADETASRATKREQRYHQEQDIFTK
jgi:hypothetical protein